MTTARGRLALGSLALGFAVVAVAQLAGPRSAPPLYDGVVPTQPYRWLQPPPGKPGGALGISATVAVTGGQNELIAVATNEIPPQAQIFAGPGAITLTPHASILHVSIDPVPETVVPASGYVDGNVYRILVTDQAGTVLSAPAAQKVSILLRSAQQTLGQATVERFDGTSWVGLDSALNGPGSFLAIVTNFGDFAVVAPGTSPYATLTPSASPIASAGPTNATAGTPAVVAPTSFFSPTPAAGEAPSSGGGFPSTLFLAAAVLTAIVLVAGLFVTPRRRPKKRDRRSGW